jgi:hypothetical protein
MVGIQPSHIFGMVFAQLSARRTRGSFLLSLNSIFNQNIKIFNMRGLKVYQNHVAFWGSPFSNFHKCKFVYKDVVWKSSEQCFMAMKAKHFKDEESYKRILESTTPKEAKDLGRKVKNFNSSWNIVSESIMFDIVLAKFSQNDDLRSLILSDEFKGKKFVEGSPSDKKWGVGMRWDNPKIDDESNWKGSNLLGKVLDKVREQLQNNPSMNNNEKITNVIIPNSRKTVKKGEFSIQEDLLSVEMPDSVTIIKEGAFWHCTHLESIRLSNNLKTIEESAFYQCEALKSITLPEGLEHIDNSAFYKCSRLTSVEIPSSVQYIGDDAFGMCSNLKHIRIPKGTVVSEHAFRETPNVEVVRY